MEHLIVESGDAPVDFFEMENLCVLVHVDPMQKPIPG